MPAEQLSDQPTVVVTTAGSAATPGTILHLRRQGYRVIATDTDTTAPGLYLADRSYLVPPGDTDDYLPEIRRICRAENAAALIPLVDEELVSVGRLASEGVPVLLPRPEFVRTCLDKYTLMHHLSVRGIPVPATCLASEWSGSTDAPVVVKPRSGRGSRGVTTCASAAELARRIADGPYSADDLIVQEQIPGTEFTVSVVAWRDGGVQAIVPKQIILKRGVTQFAVTRRSERVADVCRAVQRELRADGPFNVQLSLDAEGEPRIFEINPRFSSTAPLTVAAGVDEMGGLLHQATCGGPGVRDEWREGLVMVRRWAEEFLDEQQFTAHGIEPSGSSTGDRPRIAQAAR